MAGYKETFGSNVDFAYGRGVSDIGGRLQRGVSQMSALGAGMSSIASQAKNARRSMKELNNEIADKKAQLAVSKNAAQQARLTAEITRSEKAVKRLRKEMAQLPLNILEKGFGNLTKGLVSMNASILTIGFDFLIDSIKRVYELQEKWAKAIGGFNMKMGGMTAGLKGATQAATRWSGVVRGLTNGDITEGIELFGEFTMALGRVVKRGDQFEKFGLQLARGFNLGGAGAGKLTQMFENIGVSGDEAAEIMKTTIKSANTAGIPVNMLAEDLLKSTSYMARFGKESQKTLVQGAAWARKFDISLEQLRTSVEGLDKFDDAAKAASELNTAFGTMINSMDLMMEDDPAKRLDMIRQQFLAQGMTFDKLSPKQRRYFTETMKLSEEQTAALLSSGQSYSEFQAAASKRDKQDLDAKKMMEKQLRATAQTLYAFGAAFDRITVAIGNAIKPLLVALGLAKDGKEKFTSFGQVMESITVTVERFFNSLAENDKWKDFMKTLAVDLKKAASALKDFVFDGGAAEMVGKLAGGMKSFYTFIRDAGVAAIKYLDPMLDIFIGLSKHIKEIAIAWAGLKLFNGVGGIGALSKLGGAGGLGKGIGRATSVGGGIAMGGVLGGNGAMAGGALGGLAGMFMGPLGAALAPLAGALVGKAIDWLLGDTKTGIQVAREQYNKVMEHETKVREGLSSLLEATTMRQEAQDKIRSAQTTVLTNLDSAAAKQKDKTIVLNDMEAEMFRARADELTKFSKSTLVSKGMLENLAGGATLTKAQLDALVVGAQAYQTELDKLRQATQIEADRKMAELQAGNMSQQKTALEAVTKAREAELKVGKQQLDDMGGSLMDELKPILRVSGMGGKGSADILELAQKGTLKLNAKQMARLEKEAKLDQLEMANLNDQKRLQILQTDYLRESLGIQLRQSVMGSNEFMNYSSSIGDGLSLDTKFKMFLLTPAARAILGSQDAINLVNGGPNIGGIIKGTQAASVRAMPQSYMMSSPNDSPNFAAGGANPQSVMSNVNVNVTLQGDARKFMSVSSKNAIQK